MILRILHLESAKQASISDERDLALKVHTEFFEPLKIFFRAATDASSLAGSYIARTKNRRLPNIDIFSCYFPRRRVSVKGGQAVRTTCDIVGLKGRLHEVHTFCVTVCV
jgi:hypothetical protein